MLTRMEGLCSGLQTIFGYVEGIIDAQWTAPTGKRGVNGWQGNLGDHCTAHRSHKWRLSLVLKVAVREF